MKWVRERDHLIAQTMAFVQSVTGKRPEDEAQFDSTAVDEFKRSEPSAGAAERPRTPSVVRSAIREEVEGRVAAFRAHQQRFDRERDKHFNAVLTGIRSAIANPSKVPPP
jgi:hypothetical protein